jgi:hypothetical protein
VAEPGPASRRSTDWWVTVGIAVSAISAAVSSFSGLRALAIAAGWSVWLAWLLPVTIDSYAMTATRVWLAASTGSARARRFARWNASGAILLSLAGNATWHLIAAHLLVASWGIVLAVGAVPALILGLTAHLAVLRGKIDPVPVAGVVRAVPAPSTAPARPSQPAVRPEAGPWYASEDELVAAARVADTAHRARTGGRPLTRDGLRRELRISGARATTIVRRLKAERESGGMTRVEA